MSNLTAQYVKALIDPNTGLIMGFEDLQGREGLLPGHDQSGLFNFNPKNYPNARKAIANVKSGTANFSVLCMGDSTTAGYNGISTANEVGNSWVRRLADQLTAMGIQAGWQNVIGDHNATGNLAGLSAYDTRVSSVPAGWGQFGTPGNYLGYDLFYNNSTTNPLTFTPTVQTDSLDVYYLDISGYSPITIKSGAAGATTPTTGGTVTITGASTIKKATATYTLGSNVWTIAGNGTAPVILVGWSAYNSANREISLLNCGNGGQSSGQITHAAQFWESLSSISSGASALICPLAIISFGINDGVYNTGSALYGNLSTAIAALQAARDANGNGTDVLLMIPPPSSTASVSAAQQAIIVAAYYQLAAAYGVALVDLSQRWVSFTSANGYGYFGDGVHPSSPVGYTDMAAAIAQFFKRL